MRHEPGLSCLTLFVGSGHAGTPPPTHTHTRTPSTQTQQRPTPKGHVIAARITAENPDQGFKPSSGAMQELNFRSSNNVWGYFSVGVSGGLHEFADSQVCIASRPDCASGRASVADHAPLVGRCATGVWAWYDSLAISSRTARTGSRRAATWWWR